MYGKMHGAPDTHPRGGKGGWHSGWVYAAPGMGTVCIGTTGPESR